MRTAHRIAGATLAAVVLLTTACASPTSKWRRRQQQQFEEETASLVKRPTKPEDSPKEQRRLKRVRDVGAPKLDRLAKKLGAKPIPLEDNCKDTLCSKRALDPFFARLDELQQEREGHVRILHLGDSHIAADYITRIVRRRLQARFGNGGRGFVAIDQRARYGGRRLQRKGWKRTRVVDRGQRGRPFGFSGMAIHAQRSGAEVDFELEPEDDDLVVYYQAERQGSKLHITVEGEEIGTVDTRARRDQSSTKRFEIPEHRLGGATPPESLKITAKGEGPTLMGLSFESMDAGLIYDSIGPVGADARVYLSLNKDSLRAHLQQTKPHLIVIMVGGNDALMVRQDKRTLGQVKKDHVALIRRLKQFSPKSACLFFGPMDAAERLEDGTIVTKRFVPEVVEMQRQVAKEEGCAFWDTFEAMGGNGSFGTWLKEEIMNEDLVHPRAVGGDLIGHLFALSLLGAYLD